MRRVAVVVCCTAAALLCACITAPEVAQGVVVSHDEQGQTLVIRDEREPHAELAISLSDAEVGADIEPGDEVRIAYLRDGDTNRATRVMNLTRQAEVGKKGAKGSGGH